MSATRAGLLFACVFLLGAAPPRKIPAPPPPALKLGKGDRILARHPRGACGAAFSLNGKLAATSGGDAVIRVCDLTTGKELRHWQAPADFLRDLAFSPDGKLLASGSNEAVIRLWDPATGKEVRQLPGHAGGVYQMVFTPDGKTLVSGGFDEHVRVRDLATGKERWSARAHTRVVYALGVSPDGKTLATGGDSGSSLRLWDLATGKERASWSAHTQYVYSACFSPDGRWLATGGGDSQARLWEVATGKEVRSFDGHNNGVFRTCFSPDGRMLATGSYHKHVHLWELATGKEVYRFGEHNTWVWQLAYAPDGRSLLTTSDDTTAVLWDLAGRAREVDGPAALKEKDCEALWRDLGGDDARRAYQAVWTLAGDPEQAVRALRSRLAPAVAPPVDGAKIARLIADLDSDVYEIRQKATQELDRLGSVALPALRRALSKPPSLEAHRRMEALVARHTKGPPPESLQGLRALHVLELAGTPAARDLVAKLAGGDPDALLTLEAKATLARLGRLADR